MIASPIGPPRPPYVRSEPEALLKLGPFIPMIDKSVRLTRTCTVHNDSRYGHDGSWRLYTVTATILNGQILTGGNAKPEDYLALE